MRKYNIIYANTTIYCLSNKNMQSGNNKNKPVE